VKRADRIANSDRCASQVQAMSARQPHVVWSQSFSSALQVALLSDLVFSGTLYVDIVPTEVSSLSEYFSVCRERMPTVTFE